MEQNSRRRAKALVERLALKVSGEQSESKRGGSSR